MHAKFEVSGFICSRNMYGGGPQNFKSRSRDTYRLPFINWFIYLFRDIDTVDSTKLRTWTLNKITRLRQQAFKKKNTKILNNQSTKHTQFLPVGQPPVLQLYLAGYFEFVAPHGRPDSRITLKFGITEFRAAKADIWRFPAKKAQKIADIANFFAPWPMLVKSI